MSSQTLTLFVEGRVTGQGSKNRGRGGRYYEASKHLRPWRTTVAEAVRTALSEHPDFDTEAAGYAAELTFIMQRPKSHHVASDRARPLRESAPSYCSTTPDIDKASRAVLDALTQAWAFHDDRLVVRLAAEKVYATDGQQPGLQLALTPVEV